MTSAEFVSVDEQDPRNVVQSIGFPALPGPEPLPGDATNVGWMTPEVSRGTKQPTEDS